MHLSLAPENIRKPYSSSVSVLLVTFELFFPANKTYHFFHTTKTKSLLKFVFITLSNTIDISNLVLTRYKCPTRQPFAECFDARWIIDILSITNCLRQKKDSQTKRISKSLWTAHHFASIFEGSCKTFRQIRHCTKKLSFPLKIYLVNGTKSAVSCGFGDIY